MKHLILFLPALLLACATPQDRQINTITACRSIAATFPSIEARVERGDFDLTELQQIAALKDRADAICIEPLEELDLAQELDAILADLQRLELAK